MKNTPNFKVIVNKNVDSSNVNVPSIYKYNNTITKKLKLLNTIKARKQAYNWEQLNFPVFTYKKLNKTLKAQINNIFLILEHINNLQNNITEIQQKIHTAGLSLNLFINNSFYFTQEFDYMHHFVIIRNDKIEIHDNVELDTALVQNEIRFLHYEEDELFNLIPVSEPAMPINDLQQQIFCDLFNKYLECNDYIDVLNDDYERAFEVYEHLLTSLKLELPNVVITNLTTEDKPEIFNDLEHDIISLNKNSSIEIYYVNKEFQEEFIDFLMADQN